LYKWIILMTTPIPFFDGPAAIALRVKQLLDRMGDQLDPALKAGGVRIKSTTTGTVHYLFHAGPNSIAAIAAALRYSHQLATQRVNWLVKHGYARLEDDPEDRRRRRVLLTQAGRVEAENLQALLPRVEAAYATLFEELGVDLLAVLCSADEALAQTPLKARCERANLTEKAAGHA
jgi:DNA-binding MarR family transcriptional regulator